MTLIFDQFHFIALKQQRTRQLKILENIIDEVINNSLLYAFADGRLPIIILVYGGQ